MLKLMDRCPSANPFFQPQMVEKMASAERLRSEVGELETAKLSAQATAARLDELNSISMRVAALKMELARREQLFGARESSLLAEIDALNSALKKKKKSPLKKVTKAVSSAARGLQRSLESAGTALFDSPGGAGRGSEITPASSSVAADGLVAPRGERRKSGPFAALRERLPSVGGNSHLTPEQALLGVDPGQKKASPLHFKLPFGKSKREGTPPPVASGGVSGRNGSHDLPPLTADDVLEDVPLPKA
jgi:hypothetical protein